MIGRYIYIWGLTGGAVEKLDLSVIKSGLEPRDQVMGLFGGVHALLVKVGCNRVIM